MSRDVISITASPCRWCQSASNLALETHGFGQALVTTHVWCRRCGVTGPNAAWMEGLPKQNEPDGEYVTERGELSKRAILLWEKFIR